MSLIGSIFVLDDVVKNNGCNNLNYPNVTEIKDVCYDHSNEKVCVTDLYFDKAKLPETGYPVMLKIHGGGWIVGDKKFRRGYSLQLADEGLFVMTINYALSPEYKFPYPIQNCFAALQWLKDNAEKYKLDLSKLFIGGDSAGGHMTAAVCAALTNSDYREKLGCPDVGLKAVGALLYCGMYEFDDWLIKLPIADAMIRGYTGFSPRKMKNFPYFEYLNPIKYINSEFPPALVVSGASDVMTRKNHQFLMNQLDKVGVPYINYRAKQITNSFHCFHLKVWMKNAKDCLSVSRKFVTEISKDADAYVATFNKKTA
jgi:Esterase/lipase